MPNPKTHIVIHTNLYDFAKYYIDLYYNVIGFFIYWTACICVNYLMRHLCTDNPIVYQVDNKTVEFYQTYQNYLTISLYWTCGCVGLGFLMLPFVEKRIDNGIEKKITVIEIIYWCVFFCGLFAQGALFLTNVINKLPQTHDNITSNAQFLDALAMITNIFNFIGLIFPIGLTIGLIFLGFGNCLVYIIKLLKYCCLNFKFSYTKQIEKVPNEKI
jgi:hypothetical protein